MMRCLPPPKPPDPVTADLDAWYDAEIARRPPPTGT